MQGNSYFKNAVLLSVRWGNKNGYFTWKNNFLKVA